jgi:ribosomal protein S18 acetylase RimI-like enzyme
VVPARRGDGLGRALLEASIEHARERGAEVIDLGTSDDDHAAIGLYESFGFTDREGGPDGPRMRYYELEL